MTGGCRRLLLSERFGLLRIGTLAKGPLKIGGEVPERLRGELLGIILLAATGETGQILGGGGVSHRLLEEVLLLPLPGGVPMTN